MSGPEQMAMRQPQAPGVVVIAASAAIAALIIAALYFGRDVFVPIALAMLLSFALAPLTRMLERVQFPRVASVLSVVVLAFAIILGIGGLIASQMSQLAAELPRYDNNIRSKITALRGTAAPSGTLERAADMLTDLNKEINKPQDSAPSAPRSLSEPAGSDAKPIPVEVKSPPPSTLENLATLISPLLHPLTTTGVVAIFAIFTLIQREDLRNRLIKLAGSHDLQKTTVALDDAAKRIGRLFLSQLALNSVFGLVIGLGLWLIGIPSAPLWGVLAGVLRFVPYIGAVISAIFPLMLALAVDPGWTLLIWTAVLFVVVEPIAGHVIEPLLYGHSTGLSPVAVIVSATFWTTLWGPIGLVLATPLTICLVVLGRHIESLKFLDVMFGDRPALSPPELFYQRMLANDPAEALDKAEELLKEKPLNVYYDEVALKGLSLARADVDRGVLDAVHLQRTCAAASEVIAELAEHNDHLPVAETTADPETHAALDEIGPPSMKALPFVDPSQLVAGWTSETAILCVPGRDGLDEVAVQMLVQILDKHGFKAQVGDVPGSDGSKVVPLTDAKSATACQVAFVSFFAPQNAAQIRYAVRRLRRRVPSARIVVTYWGADDDIGSVAETAKADAAVVSIHEAVRYVAEMAMPALPPSADADSRKAARG